MPRPEATFRRKGVLQEGRLDNLSVSGAGVVVPSSALLAPRRRAQLRIDGVWDDVRIAAVRATADPKSTYCGVEFLAVNPDFMPAVLRLLEQSGAGGLPDTHMRD